MGKKYDKSKTRNSRGVFGAKLSIFDLFRREKVFHRQFAKTNEKEKGLMMMDIIESYFGISIEDRREFRRQQFRESAEEMEIRSFGGLLFPTEPTKIKRDEKGNIISPFASNKKLY